MKTETSAESLQYKEICDVIIESIKKIDHVFFDNKSFQFISYSEFDWRKCIESGSNAIYVLNLKESADYIIFKNRTYEWVAKKIANLGLYISDFGRLATWELPIVSKEISENILLVSAGSLPKTHYGYLTLRHPDVQINKISKTESHKIGLRDKVVNYPSFPYSTIRNLYRKFPTKIRHSIKKFLKW